MPDGHKIILKELLARVDGAGAARILDAGSGKTSLEILVSAFPDVDIDAVVYPGDLRKINSIKSTVAGSRYQLIERDLCAGPVGKRYDLAVAHLLLGEAAKFGNRCRALFTSLMAVDFNYLILVDYLEDDSVDYGFIERYWDENGFEVIRKMNVENDAPQNFDGFTGRHNVGYLVRRK